MKKKSLYVVPQSEEVSALWESVLCDSNPGLGGSEDIGYEDWVLNN